MPDSLDKWRKPGSVPAASALVKDSGPVPDADVPEADDEKDPTRFRLHVIEIRPAAGLWSYPSYSELDNVLCHGPAFTFVALVFHRWLLHPAGPQSQEHRRGPADADAMGD